MTSHEEYEGLLMKAVDGFLTEEEQPRWQEHLSGCEQCAQELASFSATHEHSQDYRERMLYEYRAMETRRAGKGTIGLGWFLVLAGYLVISGGSLWLMLTAPDVPLWIKGGVIAIVVGFGALFAKVIRDRFRTLSSDKYLEVDR